MLYIEVDHSSRHTFERGFEDEDSGATITWHVGDKIHANFIDHARLVISVQADCDELDWIIRQFTRPDGQVTIPISNTRVVRWYGDIAKQIAEVVISKNS